MAVPKLIKWRRNRKFLVVCIWKEELGAARSELPNGGLAAWANNPIDEGLCIAAFYSEMFRRVDSRDAVLIEKSYIAFDKDFVITLISKANPRSAI